MEDLLRYLVEQLVDKPKAIQISEQSDQSGTKLLVLGVALEDMGRVIGKQGKIINALRLLLKAKAIKTKQRVRLELAETETFLPDQGRGE